MADHEIRRTEPRGAALALILAAERLIATHGSDIITLQDITKAAQVANVSAINYHFGSREALLQAVFQFRVGAINARRHAYLDQLAETGKLLDPRSLVQAMAYPLSEQLVLRPEGNYYLRFLERTTRDRAVDMVLWARQRKLPPMLSGMTSVLTSWGECERHLRAAMAWLPQPVVDFRMQLLRVHVLSGLASIEAMLEHGTTLPADLAQQLGLLVDAAVAMLVGPISAEVLPTLGGLPGVAPAKGRAAALGGARPGSKAHQGPRPQKA